MSRTRQTAAQRQSSHSPRKSLKKAGKSLKGPSLTINENPYKSAHTGHGGIKKPHRFRPGTVALRQIRKYQKSSEILIPHAPFVRHIRLLLQDLGEFRMSTQALEMIKEEIQDFILCELESSNRIAIHSKRVTVMGKDLIFQRGNKKFMR